MAVNSSNYENVSIDDYVDELLQIYKVYLTSTGTKTRSVLDIWLHAVDHASRVGEAVRKLDYFAALDELAEVAVWVMNFVGKCQSLKPNRADGIFYLGNNLSLSDIIWNKYPAVCQYCLETPCQCLLYSKELEERHRRWNNKKEDETAKNQKKQQRKSERKQLACNCRKKRPRSILQWEEMFRKIYENNIFHSSIETIAFHLLEEVGEVAKAIISIYTWREKGESRYEKRQELKEELADVMSWTFTLVLKLQDEFKEVEHGAKKFGHLDEKQCLRISLADAIWQKYGIDNNLRCRICKHSPCDGETYFSARDGFRELKAPNKRLTKPNH